MVTAPAPESSGNQSSESSHSTGSGISIYGTGSNGVGNWNSGLNPLFSIDMTDPFWSAFFLWGQKSLKKRGSGPETFARGVKDIIKAGNKS